MLKKISVFTFLLSLILTLVVPVQARAESVYSFKEWCADNGYYISEDYSLNNNYNYVFFDYDGELRCIGAMKEAAVYWSKPFLYVANTEQYDLLVLDETTDTFCFRNSYAGDGTSMYCVSIFYSGFTVYDSERLDNVIVTPTINPYTFNEWCADAGLTCDASTNESDSVIPFWYEPDNYNYIVRKTLTASSTSGVYQLTMLQKTDGAHYPYYFEVNDIGYLGVAGAFSSINTFTVRNFYYDAEGNGWKLVEKFDVSTLPFDNANVTFSDNVVFIYSDCDIYADREASAVWQSASTEYYNVDIPEPEAPTPTPTTVPSSGAGRPGSGTRPDTGGEATGGGGLDFIINLFTLIWTKICSIPMAVDGYSISLQQIFVYGALVSIVGGFIIKFIFRR